MSVKEQNLVVYGWKLPYEVKNIIGNTIDFYEDEKYEPYLNKYDKEQCTILWGGMNGDYTIIGLLLSEIDSETMDEVELPNQSETENMLWDFKVLMNIELREKPKLICFCHTT